MIYRFENFELDLDRFELRQDGVAVDIQPQVFTLIVLLATNKDRMVSKEEMNDRIWGGRVVSEAALSSRIKAARQALQDDGKQQRLIRTIHGKGFRFVGSLESSEPVAESAGENEAESPRQTAQPRIIILPFANMSGDAEQEYFSDAITQDIVATLSKHRWLDVVAMSTGFGYKGQSVDVRQLAKELNVDYVVEGSVRRSGNRIRVAAQLVDADTANQRWADRYDREMEDVFAVQDEITAKIVARLEPEIGAAERRKVVRAVRRDLKAWDCYHLGIFHFFKFTAEDNLEAQRLLLKSRELDPEFGEAHAWWAYAVVLGMVYWDTNPSPDLLDEALAATEQALRLDDQNAVFYSLKARVQLARGEYSSALTENEMAVELNPTLASAYCGLADSLAYEGRYDEALEFFVQAIELSPNDPQRWAFLTYGALALIFKGDYEKAVRWADRAGAIPNCQYWSHAHKAVALAYLGRKEEVAGTLLKLFKAMPEFDLEFAGRKLFFIKDSEQRKCYLDGLALAGVS